MDRADRQAAALDAVLELTILLGEDMRAALAEAGLTTARTALLWRLQHDGPRTQRQLADALGVTPRNITGLVDGLEATGFVTREPHPTDRRATLVTLTAKGAGLMAEMAIGHRALAEQLFGGLSPAGFDGFIRGLDTVLDALRAAVAEERS